MSRHYTWGDGCDGWHLQDSAELSVIYERMPPATCERMHRHTKAKQFFFITKGTAELWLAGKTFKLVAYEGLEILPGEPHQIFNRSAGELEFVLVSSPRAHGDRENL